MLPSLLLSAFSWSSAAWAEDGASAARMLASPLQVAATVNELRLAVGSVLVVADGAEAEKVANTAAAAMPPGTVRVVRVDAATDDATRAALAKSGLRCGLRVGPQGSAGFPGVTVGDCSAKPVAAASGAPPVATAPGSPSASPSATPSGSATTPAPSASPSGAPAAGATGSTATSSTSKPASPPPTPTTPAAAPSAPVVAGPPVDPRSLASPLQVAAYVNEARVSANGPVLIAAAGSDAERVAQKVAEAMPAGQARVARIGYLGDEQDEVGRALTASGLRCAVRLGTTSAATFTVARFGDCSNSGGTAVVAPAATALPPPGTPGAPASPGPTATPGSTASIPGASAALGTPAPTVVREPVGPPPPPPPPDPKVLEATYEQVSLRRVKNPNPLDDPPDPDWAVRDGRGRTLTATEFASRVGDTSSKARLERDTKTARALSISLAAGGGALTVAGLGVLLARDSGAPDWDDFEVDPLDYETNDEYFDAKAQAEADYKAAQRDHRIIADDRAWIAGFLTGSGLLALGTSAFAGRGVLDRQKQSALYWTPDQADSLIKAHNASLRQSLGLPPELQPAQAVIVKTPPPPEEEEEEEDEDPPEDSAPATDPAGPSGSLDRPHPDLALHPVVGLAWLGVAGSF